MSPDSWTLLWGTWLVVEQHIFVQAPVKRLDTHTHSVWDLVQAHMPAGDLLMLHQKGAGLLQLWSFVEQDLRKMFKETSWIMGVICLCGCSHPKSLKQINSTLHD